MKECSKSIPRRLADANFINRYFVGHGLDIGGKPDPLSLYQHLFCRMESVRIWDLEDGDAQYLMDVPDASYDFVHSSHCLEHLNDPSCGIENWLRVLKPGGHLVVTVPDEDLYEQGVFPSTFNRDHKWTFTSYKSYSWSSRSINVIELITKAGDEAEILRIEQLSLTYRFDLPRYDQTLTPIGEIGIEFVIRKRPGIEIKQGGRWQTQRTQPTYDIRIHLNQYRNDQNVLRQYNGNTLPFKDGDEL